MKGDERRKAIGKEPGRDSPKGRRFLISGRVQGVGFRYFAQRVARETGVGGWVRNLDDGRVEVCASGSADQLNAIESRLRMGPSSADIRGFETIEEAPLEDAQFRIR